MNKVIYLLFFLFIITWVFQWKLTAWKVEEIKQASEDIEKKMNEVSYDLDQVVKQYMKDPEAWERVKP